MSIGADSVVDEASWVDVADSILAAVGIGGAGVEGVPADLHVGDSGRRPVSFNDRRIIAELKQHTTSSVLLFQREGPPIPVDQRLPLKAQRPCQGTGKLAINGQRWRYVDRGLTLEGSMLAERTPPQ